VVRHSNKCLDISGGIAAVEDGWRAQQFSCLGYYQLNQKWHLYSYTAADGRTIYYLVAIHSGKCLDSLGGPAAINNGNPSCSGPASATSSPTNAGTSPPHNPQSAAGLTPKRARPALTLAGLRGQPPMTFSTSETGGHTSTSCVRSQRTGSTGSGAPKW
jgi:hypothetical protein